MSASDLETMLGTALLAASFICTMYALPSWITRRCER